MAWRKWARHLHWWCGVSLGTLLFVIGLSGASLVYYVELDRWLNPAISAAARQSSATAAPDWDQALHTLRQAYPDKNGPWRFEMPERDGVIASRYNNPPETAAQGFAPMLVWLTADGKQIIRQDYWGQHLMTWLYNLHYQLLLGPRGAAIVGYIGLASVFLLVSGLISWWPKAGHWRQAFRFKKRQVLIGSLYDWHKTLGWFFALPLLLLCITGAMLALPAETRTVLHYLTGPVQQPQLPVPQRLASDSPLPSASLSGSPSHSLSSSFGGLLSPSAALLLAQQSLPSGRLAWLEIPASDGGFYRARLQLAGDPSQRFPHSYVHIDAVSGKVVSVFQHQQQGTSNIILNWLHPLHDGSFLGHPGRILWVLSGIACGLLYLLGLWRWWLRRAVRY